MGEVEDMWMFGQLGADVRADVAHEFTLPDPLMWLKITSYPFAGNDGPSSDI